MPVFVLVSGPSAGLRYEVEKEAALGRSPSCEIPLEDGKVSRRHARVFIDSGGQAKVADLGSRNGTLVNGERIEGEAVLLPGDRVQIGDTTVLFEPSLKASLHDRALEVEASTPVEELLPHVGAEAALYTAGISLIGAQSEAMVLRRAAEELRRVLSADRAAALLGGSDGLVTAAVVGAEAIEVPRALVKAALERAEVGMLGGALCVPLSAAGGSPFGILYCERTEPLAVADRRLAATIGRVAGEAFAMVRSRSDREPDRMQLVGSAKPFRRAVEQGRRAATGDEAILIQGDSGTGKTLLAQYIQSRSTRALGPQVVVDCRFPHAKVDEALFGRGSAPGIPPLSSALLRADGGTLLLLHLDALSSALVDRLARYLSREVAPARQGGEEPVDVRVIATSAAASPQGGPSVPTALAKLFGKGVIDLVALSERRTDIPLLFDFFLAEGAKWVRGEPARVTSDARKRLSEYAWPGNVREMKLVAERLATLYSGQEISTFQLPPEIQEGGPAGTTVSSLQERINRIERDAVAEALRVAHGKKIRAAALLGISRPTLDKKIEDFGLVVEKDRRN